MNSENRAREWKESQGCVSTTTLILTLIRGAAGNKWKLSHHNLQDGLICRLSATPLHIWEIQHRNHSVQSWARVSASAFPPAQLPRHSQSGQEQQHNQIRAQSLGSSQCCSAASKAAVLGNHHANGENLLAGTEYQNEQFLLLRKVCPFLSAFAEVKMNSPEI